MSDDNNNVTFTFKPLSVVTSGYYGDVAVLFPTDGYGAQNDGQYMTALRLDNSTVVDVFLTEDMGAPVDAGTGIPVDMTGDVTRAISALWKESQSRRNAVWAAEAKLDSFKESARETLIDAWKGHFESSSVRYCDEFNDLLRALGMAEYFGTHSVSVTITADVAADDEDDAYSILRDAISVNDSRVSNEDWE